MISYDQIKNNVNIKFNDYDQLLEFNGTNFIKITLVDKDKARKEYQMFVTFYEDK